MKNSITFTMAFVASLTAFSPFAVAEHTNFSSRLDAGKHCELQNLPDNQVVAQYTAPTKTAGQKVHSANDNQLSNE